MDTALTSIYPFAASEPVHKPLPSLLVSDHQCVQSGVRKRGGILASGPFARHSELAHLSCDSLWAAEHDESRLLHSAAHLPAIADTMVPQVLQESVRTRFPQVPSRGQCVASASHV